jgi:ABC-type branched-subunit amino acid transport system permease subunit
MPGMPVSVVEATRFLSDLQLPITDPQFAQIRLIIVGLLLILLMQRRRQGLWPYRYRRREAQETRAQG